MKFQLQKQIYEIPVAKTYFRKPSCKYRFMKSQNTKTDLRLTTHENTDLRNLSCKYRFMKSQLQKQI